MTARIKSGFTPCDFELRSMSLSKSGIAMASHVGSAKAASTQGALKNEPTGIAGLPRTEFTCIKMDARCLSTEAAIAARAASWALGADCPIAATDKTTPNNNRGARTRACRAETRLCQFLLFVRIHNRPTAQCSLLRLKLRMS